MTYPDFLQVVEMHIRERVEPELSVETYAVNKNNGVRRDGVILRDPLYVCAPIFYLDDFYDLYQNGYEIEYIVDDIMKRYAALMPAYGDVRHLDEYELIKKDLRFKLVNYEKNKEQIKGAPYIPYKDLAVIFYVNVPIDGQDGLIFVDEHLFEPWNVETQEMFRQAKENMRVSCPVRFFPMADYLRQHGAADLDDTDCGFIFVVTNEKLNYGASVILYDHLLEDIAHFFDSSFYIIPSSVHEILVIPERYVLPGCELNTMIREVNCMAVASDEILADHYYYYDREMKTLSH